MPLPYANLQPGGIADATFRTVWIVYWNSTYIADAVQHLHASGTTVDPELLPHSSPVGWEHIAFSGDFLWDRAAERTRRKPLNVIGDNRAA